MDKYFGPSENVSNDVSIETNVIIVGAGPAGAAASIFLTKAGVSHVIIEKETFPRDKICGDACSGKTAFVLRKANPQWMEDIFKNNAENMPSYGVIFTSPNGKSLAIPFNTDKILAGQAPGFVTPRLVFDNFLFEKLASPHATIFQHSFIQSIQRQPGEQVKVTFTQGTTNYNVTAPLIIGADGDKSQVRKVFLHNNIPSKAYCVGLRAYYNGVTGMHKRNYVKLHFLPELLPGYFWIFPLANGMANVGVGMLSEKIKKNKINLREQMLQAIKNNPDISPRFTNATLVGKIEGCGLPMYIKKQPLSGSNFLLAGDAGGLIDPFTGEGIGNALFSGMLAAFAAIEGLQAGKYDAEFIKEKYDDVLFKRIGDELNMSVLLQRLSNYPWLFNFVVKKAHKSHTLNTAITSMFTDLDLRKQLRTPAFYAKILFNK